MGKAGLSPSSVRIRRGSFLSRKRDAFFFIPPTIPIVGAVLTPVLLKEKSHQTQMDQEQVKIYFSGQVIQIKEQYPGLEGGPF